MQRITNIKCSSKQTNPVFPIRMCAFVGRYSHTGFTLVEMLISMAIFSFVMLGTAAVLLRVVDANHKAQALKTATDNISLALDSMVRNMRLGRGYQCGGIGGGDCASTPSSTIAFLDRRGISTVYRLNAGVIEVSKNGGDFVQVTAPEITIDRLDFYVDGTVSASKRQPRVFVVVGGVVNGVQGASAKTRARFDVETLVSQRFIDLQ